MITRFELIKGWDESDLSTLPTSETAEYEYKSSKTGDEDLKGKIAKAASAFWNSGGGYLVIGVDDTGRIDGGITGVVGKQKRRDWIDQAIMIVSPPGPYDIREIIPAPTGSRIHAGNLVAIIAFEESVSAPHMAHDYKYYVRLGAHSEPARHFLIEAIRAKKYTQTPMIRAILRSSERKDAVIELAVVVVNDAAALDIELTFDPLPKSFAEGIKDSFPLHIPLIDQRHEFSTELFRMLLKSELFGDVPVLLKMDYHDILGNRHHYEQEIDPKRNRVPHYLDADDLANVEKAIKGVSKSISDLNHIIEAAYKKKLPPVS